MTPEGLTALAEVERPSNPFPGLRPFEFGESHLYFGRDGQSDQLIRKLAATRFVAVVGTSGSGKSSLVRAGLLPDLFGGLMSSAGSHWRVSLMRPSNDPLGNLARALNTTDVFGSDIEENAQIQTAITEATLRRGGLGLVEAVRQNRMPANESLLVVVDQFEELFRFARVAGTEQYRYEAAAFVKLLLEAARQREQNIYVVLTMRSDFLGDCSIFWDLPEAINEGQYLIPRMTRDQRAEAVTGPVAVGGGHIAQRLVNRLLNDTGDNPDMLPILQHALMRTWENWSADHAEGEPLDLRHYEAVGTMSDALSRHADEAWDELPDERARQIAERVFKALTEKGEDNREVRRPTVLGELCALTGASASELIPVLEVFRREGRSFLMPPASVRLDEESLVDISHESLIRNWQRLKEWVDEESQSAQIYQRLAETAVLHERGHAGLWRDPDLQLALDWRERTRPAAAWAARYHPAFDPAMKFLDASVAARDAAALEEERRRRREIRRTRFAALVFFLLFMLSLVAFAYAYTQTLRAQEALGRANEATQVAQIALAQSQRDNERANEQTKAAERSAEIAKEAKDEALKKQKEAEESKAEAVESAEAASLSARRAEESRLEAERQKVEAENQKVEAERQKNSAEAAAATSRRLLYAADMNLAQQAYEASNVQRGREILNAHAPGGEDAPGFEWFYLWRTFHGEKETLVPGEPVFDFKLSRDGRTLVVARHYDVEIWDVASRRMRGSVKGNALRSLDLSPDGRYVAVPSAEGAEGGKLDSVDVSVFDAVSLSEVATLRGRKENVYHVGFSGDGQTLAVGSGEHKVELWDVATMKKRAELEHTSAVSTVAFSPDGSTLAASGADGTVKLWGLKTNAPLCSFQAHERLAGSLAFSPSGEALFTSSMMDDAAKLWDASSCKQVATFAGAGSHISSLALSPDGRTLFVAYDNNTMKVWDVKSRGELATLKGHREHIGTSTFMPDGKTLLTGSLDGTVKLWDIAAHVREQSPPQRHTGFIDAVAFSPDGKKFVTGSGKQLVAWDAGTHQALNERVFGEGNGLEVRSAAFSPDGRTLAVGTTPVRLLGMDLDRFQPEKKRDAFPFIKMLDPDTLREVATFPEQHSGVMSLAFSPDGRALVTGHSDGTLKLWDAGSAALLKELKPERYAVAKAVAFSPDGKLIGAVTGYSLVKVWDNTLSRELASLRQCEQGETQDGSNCWPNQLAFSPRGDMLAVSNQSGLAKVFDVAGGKLLATLSGHRDAVYGIAFSPDGRTLVTGGTDETVKLWRVDTFKELFTLKPRVGLVRTLAFSPPDGSVLAAGGLRRTMLFRAATGEEVKARGR